MNKIIDSLNWRYATKKFDSKKISNEDMETLTEALRLSPSSFGVQPWKFVVVKNPELRGKLKEAVYGQTQPIEASDLIVLCRFAEFTTSYVSEFIANVAKDKNIPVEALKGYEDIILGTARGMSKEKMDTWMEKQVYIALGFLLETAAFMQIDTCPMEGFDREAFDSILGLDKLNLKSVVICPVGYRSSEDKNAGMKKFRNAKEEVIVTLQ